MRGAVLLALASLMSGGLNFACQAHAAAVLDASAFGAFSAWFSRVTLFGTLATVLQFASLEVEIGPSRLTAGLRVVAVVSSTLIGLTLALRSRFDATLLGVISVGGSLCFSAVVGQLQRRLSLGAVGTATLVMSAFRFALPYLVVASARGPWFFLAQALAAPVGTVILALATGLRAIGPVVPYPRGVTAVGARLVRPVVLSAGLVAFPVLDVLCVSAMCDAEEVGHFARVALASRVVVFGGAALLQALYPHELAEARTKGTAPRLLLLALRTIPLVTLGAAPLFAMIADHLVLHADGSERVWLHLTCISAGLLVVLLSKVQSLGATLRLYRMAWVVVGVIVAHGAALVLARGSIDRYVALAVMGDVGVLALTWLTDYGSRGRRTLG